MIYVYSLILNRETFHSPSKRTNFKMIPLSCYNCSSLLTQSSITVTSPNFGEVWKANSTQIIKWESEDISTVTIEYPLDNGLSWEVIVSSIEASLGEFPGGFLIGMVWVVSKSGIPKEFCI